MTGIMCARCRDVDRIGIETWKKGRGLGWSIEGRERWSVEETERFYRDTLESAASVANWSVSKGFEDSRRRTFEEFQDFLGLVGQGKRIETATSLDIIAFVHGFWIKKHKEQCRTVAGGERVASASAIKGCRTSSCKEPQHAGVCGRAEPGKNRRCEKV
jgi:hypothetical protein